MSNVDPLLKILIDAGYKVEACVGSEKTTSVVEIPIDSGTGVRPQSEVSMWEQIQLAQFVQRYWADNQVSVTVTFKKEEGKDIARVLDYAQYGLKGVSFLPYLDPKDSPYPQMPYEPITETEYETALKGITKPVDYDKLNKSAKDAEGEAYCDGDKCVRH